jgi:hypothetical protein
MRKSLGVTVVVAFATASAWGANLNLTVRSGGSSSIQVSPGANVDYEVAGTLSDTNNLGIALWGADLDFDGGDLNAANIPVTPPMDNFVPNLGITNPSSPCPNACGYGGTIISGNLVQCGGGQNTINNTAGNALFPVGPVTTNIGQSEVVLLTGSLTAPAAPGIYTLSNPSASVFGNQIKAGEDGVPFWATEAFGVGTLIPLTIEVVGGVSLISANPFCEDSLSRLRNNTLRLTFSSPISAPSSSQIEILQMAAGGGFSGLNLAANFSLTVEGNTLVLRDAGTTLANGTWYSVRNNGTWPGVDNFKVDYVAVVGDADNTSLNDFADLSFIFANLTGVADDVNRSDINADTFVDFADISDAFGFNGSIAPVKPSGHTCFPIIP